MQNLIIIINIDGEQEAKNNILSTLSFKMILMVVQQHATTICFNNIIGVTTRVVQFDLFNIEVLRLIGNQP